MADQKDISSQFGGTLDAPKGSGKHRRRGKRFFVLLTAWILLALACGGAGYYYLAHILPAQQAANTNNAHPGQSNATVADPTVTYASVDGAAIVKKGNGDVAGAAQVYQAAAATATTPTDKSYLYSSEAAIYSNAGQYDKALQPALDNFNAQPSEGSAELVADIYEHLGNKDQAIVYYEKAAALADPNDPASYGADYYQAKADSLK